MELNCVCPTCQVPLFFENMGPFCYQCLQIPDWCCEECYNTSFVLQDSNLICSHCRRPWHKPGSELVNTAKQKIKNLTRNLALAVESCYACNGEMVECTVGPAVMVCRECGTCRTDGIIDDKPPPRHRQDDGEMCDTNTWSRYTKQRYQHKFYQAEMITTMLGNGKQLPAVACKALLKLAEAEGATLITRNMFRRWRRALNLPQRYNKRWVQFKELYEMSHYVNYESYVPPPDVVETVKMIGRHTAAAFSNLVAAKKISRYNCPHVPTLLYNLFVVIDPDHASWYAQRFPPLANGARYYCALQHIQLLLDYVGIQRNINAP